MTKPELRLIPLKIVPSMGKSFEPPQDAVALCPRKEDDR